VPRRSTVVDKHVLPTPRRRRAGPFCIRRSRGSSLPLNPISAQFGPHRPGPVGRLGLFPGRALIPLLSRPAKRADGPSEEGRLRLALPARPTLTHRWVLRTTCGRSPITAPPRGRQKAAGKIYPNERMPPIEKNHSFAHLRGT
jgi:hypothetical protein